MFVNPPHQPLSPEWVMLNSHLEFTSQPHRVCEKKGKRRHCWQFMQTYLLTGLSEDSHEQPEPDLDKKINGRAVYEVLTSHTTEV